MDCEGNMTEETLRKLNDILENALRWLEAQADHLEFQNEDREWWAEEYALTMLEAEFDWLFKEEWA